MTNCPLFTFSPDVSISSISTSSFTTASSNITVNNIPSSQVDSKPNATDSSTNTATVAYSNSAPTIPSYSSALLGHNNNHQVISDHPPKYVQPISNLPVTPPQQQNVMLTASNPPDITVQFTNSSSQLKAQASLPDVTAQASTSADGNISVNSTPNGDSGSNTPPPYFSSTEINSINSPSFPKMIPVADIYQEGFTIPAMQQGNSGGVNEPLSSETNIQVGSPTSCFFVDDNRAVAIVLSERAYNNSYNINDDGQNVDISMKDNGNEQHANVPAVTILGRGETPVADWSSRCDGLEFGGPINEDLLSMDYSTHFNINHEVINFVDPHDSSYYQEIQVPEGNSNLEMGALCKNGDNEQIAYETPQCIISNDSHQERQLPLPDMDEAIVSFGECLEQATPINSGAEPSSQIAPHTFNTDDNELNDQDPNDKMRSDKNICYEEYERPGSPNSLALKINTYVDVAQQSTISVSPNSSEGKNPHSVPLSNELDDFSATNWANEIAEKVQMEADPSQGVDEPSSFIQGNLVYNANAECNETNSKVNYNYQEILSFVSNSWQQVEKELTAGANVNYYHSNAEPNNKANSSIVKLNKNVQTQ